MLRKTLNHFDIFQKISKNIMSEPCRQPLQALRHLQNNALITIFCLVLYTKDFEILGQKTLVIGELQVLKKATHEQILLIIPSPQNDVTLMKTSIFINPI